MSTMTTTRTIEYSCRPFASLALDDHGDAMSRILGALEADPRALGAVVGFDDELGRVDATFQVAVGGDFATVEYASAQASIIFDAALEAAGLEQRTAGLAIVEGDDPDLLP